MSRPLPATFRPIPVQPLGVGHPIREGSDTAKYGELDLLENIHWAWAELRSPVVNTLFGQDSDAVAGTQAYLIGAPSGAPVVRALWFVPVVGRWVTWSFSALVENTSGTDAATLRFDLGSDPHPGTYVDITVGVSTAAWTEVTGILALPASGAYETIRCLPINGATGELRVHAVCIYPTARSSVPGTSHTYDGATWIPGDTEEYDASSALTVASRRKLFGDLDYIRRSSVDVVLGWSDNANYRTEAYKEIGATYVEQLRLPFRTGPTHSALRWGLYGFSRGATPRVRLQTATGEANGVAAVEATLPSGWTADFAANLVKYDDGGMTTLPVTPNSDDELVVDLKYGSLMALSVWLV